MSFISAGTKGVTHAAGWFLAEDEIVTRKTKTIAQSGATTGADGSKHVKMGTPYPSNDSNAIGIVYEDVDVSTGDMPGSVVTAGTVYLDRLPVELAAGAQSALEGLGFKFIVTRPY